MTDRMNATALIIKGMISEQSPGDQERVRAMEAKLRAVIAEDADAARLAFALIGAEMQGEE
jgi:hypothetical protein